MIEGRTEAAVLAPVYRDAEGRLRLVLILRAPRGVHGGQIAFPGGRREPGDADLLETALREAEEEIGLDRMFVRVLCPLPVVTTSTTGFAIAPFLGRLEARPGAWRPQTTEVAAVLEVPVDELADPAAHGEEERDFATWPQARVMPFYRVGPYKLWGATYRIVQPLLPRLLAGEWSV